MQLWQNPPKIHAEFLFWAGSAVFGIMRLQKIKSTYSLRASLRHAYREQDTPNANPQQKQRNLFVGARSVSQALAAYEKRKSTVKGKIRANAVMAIEHLITASPDFFKTSTKKQQSEFFNKSLNWLKSTYGAENVVCSGIHLDEKTPHMWAYVIPVHQEKLNARHYIGGHKNRLSEMQTDFHQKCCAEFGLQRGIEKSKAKHTEVRHWYTVMREVFNLPNKTTAERIKLILGDGLNDLVKGAVANAAIARQAVERSQRYVQAMKTAQEQSKDVLERLKAAENVISSMEREKIARDAYIAELETLKSLVDRNKDILAKAELLRVDPQKDKTTQADQDQVALHVSDAQLRL